MIDEFYKKISGHFNADDIPYLLENGYIKAAFTPDTYITLKQFMFAYNDKRIVDVPADCFCIL